MNKLRITTLASGVDGAIRRISTVYDVSGNVKSVTSYDNAAVNSGNVVNQVLYEYDANGLLAKDFSNPSGGVLASTPYIGYTYDTTKSGDQFTKRLRLTAMKYPGGKTLNYGYGTANSDGDKLNRLTEIKDGTTSVVQYVSEGIATPMKITYPQPGLALDYTASGALDRFGRIADHAWKKSTTDVVRIKHGYDRMGNRTYRNDSVQTSNSELYGYDGVNQIKSLNRGVLNSTNTSVTTSNFTESWNYDGTGNWLQYNRSGTVENRTHNKSNEVQTSCTHDRNGNMTVMPGLKGKYDAWNRLVEVRNSSDSLLATYGYNGLNHRVKKTVGSVVTTSHFNQQWQELESITSGQVTSYVWGTRYIDDLVLREKGNERLYALADPNWNVVAVVDATGTVQERMKYDAFGKITWLDSAFATKANSGFVWSRTFTGQVLDSETGLMLYRNRYYHTGLGRFVKRDPIGYWAGDTSLYRYVGNKTTTFLDPIGFETICCTKWTSNTELQGYPYNKQGGAKCIKDRVSAMNPLASNIFNALAASGLLTGYGLAEILGSATAKKVITRAGIVLSTFDVLKMFYDLAEAGKWCRKQKCTETVEKEKVIKQRGYANVYGWFVGREYCVYECPDGSDEVYTNSNGEAWREPENHQYPDPPKK